MSITQTLIGDSIAQAMLAEFETQAPVTRRFLERLPEDKLTWKPHEKSMTAGQMAFHIASTPGGVVRFVANNPAQAPEFAKFPQPASCQEIMQTFDESVAMVRRFFPTRRRGDERNLAAVGRRQMLARPREQFLRDIMFSHVIPASRAVQRLSAHAQPPGTGELGSECRRTAAVYAASLIGRCVCAHSVLRPQQRWRPALSEPAVLQRL